MPPPLKVIKTATAWDSIGWDDGTFRIKYGNAYYQQVHYNCETGRRKVQLRRLGKFVDGEWIGLEFSTRYVEPDTVLEFLGRTG